MMFLPPDGTDLHLREAVPTEPRRSGAGLDRPDVWGGVECSIVRVGDRFRDQVAETGHHRRPGDLDLIAGLGIETLRYPVLWETVAPEAPDRFHWSFPDARLGRLRELGIGPIATLLHHGSGPAYTSLVDPAFPARLADYAGRVAERYPWIEHYTPVNEPLTTARFSGLYGHWYPHARSYPEFLRALVNQLTGTLLAMRAIRAVNPQAKLVQTEDLGKTFSTPRLAYQAGHENSRRWLSFDLLCGRVDPAHPWWDILLANGIAPSELELFLGGEGRPDILGLDHYLTSERYLDENHGAYPAFLGGGNGRHRYADVEAVRVPLDDLGPLPRLREVWDRYGLPMAVTEAHHGGPPEEQLRWLMELWNAASTLRREGADLRAVTAWALFGMVDWRSLLCRNDGHYEPGAFDVRFAEPRPTLLAEAARGLRQTGAYQHPWLGEPGWWHRQERFYAQPGTANRREAPARVAARVRARGRS